MIKIQWQEPNHQLKDITTVCLNSECNNYKLCCLQYQVEGHKGHLNQLVDFYLISYFFEMQQILKFPMSYKVDDYRYKLEIILIIENVYVMCIQDQILNLKEIQNKLQNLNSRQYIQGFKHIQQESQYLNKFIENLLELFRQEQLYKNSACDTNNNYLPVVTRIVLNIRRYLSSIIIGPHDDKNQKLQFYQYPIVLRYDQVQVGIVSQDGSMIILGSLDGTVRFLNTQTFKLIKIIIQNYPVQLITLSSENRLLAIGGHQSNEISIYNIKTNKNYWKLNNGDQNPYNIVFSDNLKFLITAGNCGSPTIWSLSLKRKIFSLDQYVRQNIIISTENQLILTRSHPESYISIWIFQIRQEEQLNSSINFDYRMPLLWQNSFDMCSLKNFSLVISNEEFEINFWSLNTSQNIEKSKLSLISTIEENVDTIDSFNNCIIKNKILQVKSIFLLDNSRIIITSEDKQIIWNDPFKITIHEIELVKEIQQLIPYIGKRTISDDSVTSISLSNDMNTLITCMQNSYYINIWTKI